MVKIISMKNFTQFQTQFFQISKSKLHILKNLEINKDLEFLSKDNLNVSNNFKYFVLTDSNKTTIYSVLKCKFPNDENDGKVFKNVFSLWYLETNPNFKDMKYGTILVEEIFKFCLKINLPFYSSFYTKDGKNYLQKVFQKMSLKYNLDFIFINHFLDKNKNDKNIYTIHQ